MNRVSTAKIGGIETKSITICGEYRAYLTRNGVDLGRFPAICSRTPYSLHAPRYRISPRECSSANSRCRIASSGLGKTTRCFRRSSIGGRRLAQEDSFDVLADFRRASDDRPPIEAIRLSPENADTFNRFTRRALADRRGRAFVSVFAVGPCATRPFENVLWWGDRTPGSETA